MSVTQAALCHPYFVAQALVSCYKIQVNLTFRGPCIVIYSYDKTNEMHQLLKFIFGIELYMFLTGSLSNIRSLVLYTQQQVYVI